MEIGEQRYLGDGVYAEYDGYHLVLTTGSSLNEKPENRVYLDTQVRNALRRILVNIAFGAVFGKD